MRLLPVALLLVLASCGGTREERVADAPEPQPPSAGEWSSVPWTLVKAQGREVVVRFRDGACVGPEGAPLMVASAAETAEAVTIAVYTRSANPCAGVALGGPQTVRLDAPLAGRQLVHATVTPHGSAPPPAMTR